METLKKQIINITVGATILALSSPSALAQQTIRYTYNPLGLVLTKDGPRADVNDTTTYTYHPNNRERHTITNALGQVIQLLDYNNRGQPGRIIDANGIETLLTYHVRGWLETVTVVDPAGIQNSVTQYTYDNVGQLTQVTLPNGTVLTYTYDGARRLTQISNSLGESITYTLDNAGNRTQEQITANGGAITYTVARTYDELSRVMDIIGAENQTTHLDYDVNGNNEVVTNPRTYVTDQDFDPLNRLTSQTNQNPSGANVTTQFGYDDQDRLTSVTDANGNVTTYIYDAFDNLRQVHSPDTGTSIYTYDDANNRISMTDARGVLANYTYDALNRLSTVSYPSASEENITYYYDNYTMDSATPDAAESSSYSVGRVTGVDGEFNRTRYYYDHRGNLTLQKDTLITPRGTKTYRTAYTYRLDNQVATMTYPTGLQVTYGYDSQGRVNQVSVDYQGQGQSQSHHYDLISNIQYAPFGPIRSLQYGNGLSLDQQYNQDYRLSHSQVLPASGTTPLVGYNYTYDANGNITDMVDLTGAPYHNYSYIYDFLDRLTEDNSTALENHRMLARLRYDYDPVGNRTRTEGVDYRLRNSLHNQDWTYSYLLDSNQLADTTHVQSGGSSDPVAYDNSGNIVSRVRRESNTTSTTEYTDGFTYNASGRLNTSTITKRFERPGSAPSITGPTTLDYGYYANGLRIFKRTDLGSGYHRHNHFVYNQAGQTLFDEYSFTINNGAIILGTPLLRQWIYLNGQPIAQISEHQDLFPALVYRDPQVVTYYLDHRGAPRMGFDTAGYTVWEAQYTAFGERVKTYVTYGQATANPLRFPGQYYDDETGLFYNWWRYYDPQTGRYLRSDPIGLGGGINTYGYAYQNPVLYIDPLGLAVQLCTKVWPNSHTYLCADGSCAGYNPSTSNILSSPGIVLPEEQNQEGFFCNDVPQRDCTEEEFTQCVSQATDNHGLNGTTYNVMTYNCGEWATQTIQQCWAQCSGN